MKQQQQLRNRAAGRRARWVISATVGVAATVGISAVPQVVNADTPTEIVCDTDENTPGIDCNGTTVELSTPDYGPGLKPVPPARIYDSRRQFARLDAGGMVSVQVAGAGGIPTNATAAMVNIAVVNPSGDGHITAYPCGDTRPTTAMLTYVANETRSGGTLVELDPTGQLCFYSHAATHIVVDVQGYIADSESPTTFAPTRVLDTRRSAPIVGEREFKLADLPELASVIDLTKPDEIAGVWLNVSTFLAPEPGYVTSRGVDSGAGAFTARLNYEAGRAQTNLIYAHIRSGAFWLTTSSSTDMTVDVVGATWHPDAFFPVDYERVLDTRVGRSETPGRLQPGVPTVIKIEGFNSPSDPTSVLVNIAVVNPSAPTHVTAYPCGAAIPTVANANAPAGSIISNAGLVPVSDDETICVVSAAETDLVVDVNAMTTTDIWAYGSCTAKSSANEPDRLAGGTPPYTLSGTLPDGVTAIYEGGTFKIVPPEGTSLTLSRSLTLTDAAGKATTVFFQWNGSSNPNPPCV